MYCFLLIPYYSSGNYHTFVFRFDAGRAALVARSLPPAGSMLESADIDVGSLEAANWAMGSKYAKKTRADGTLASPKSG